MKNQVPFFRPSIGEEEIREVEAVLRSGWLTTGKRTARFEKAFAEAVGAAHAVALSSCTAALHLATEALGLQAGEGVLVPAMTFAATAEVVRYAGAHPILVDCDPVTLDMDLADAARKLEAARRGELPGLEGKPCRVTGIIPVHVGGLMMEPEAVAAFARRGGLWVVEDAAHAFPAAWRRNAHSPWIRCGEGTADVTCFSFYANKTITTGEGGMAVTDSAELAERMRLMSLHGLSKDAWSRYASGGSWDYRIVAPGFKYNMTDIAAAIGIHQLERAEELRLARKKAASAYREGFSDVNEIELPATNAHRIHSWHLFPIRLKLDRLRISRNHFVREVNTMGVGTSVHWRPLHLHPYYAGLGWRPDDCPVASFEWERLVSLPLFPSMGEIEISYVIETVSELCRANSR